MTHRRAFMVVMVSLLGAIAFAVVARPAVSAAVPVRIMPLGDSITAGPGCWRALLWNRLQTSGYTNIDFVGGVFDSGGCNYGFTYDGDHEGHGGFSATGIADQNQLPPWLNAARPDIVVMHLGTNDMWGGFIPTSTKLAAFTKLVGQMRANNPNMKIVVAQIIPMNPSGCPTCAPDVVALNNAIPGWAAELTTAQSPIVVVDQWTGFSTATDTTDGVHPNDAGFRKMADRWYPQLAQVLDGTTTTSRPPTTTSRPPTTTSRPPTTTSRPPTTTGGTGGCSAAYAKTGEWSGGFQGEVRVTNTGTTTTNSWTVTLTFANGQRITQIWSARTSSTASPYVITNESYNNTIAPGATATFGFLGSWTTANANPTVTCARTP